MDRRVFERLVANTVNDLPDSFREKLDNVQIAIEG